jgi:Sugar (and other) transporter
MFGWSGIFAIIQFMGMIQLPESPKWLQECGRYDESQCALRVINSEYIHYTEEHDIDHDHHHFKKDLDGSTICTDKQQQHHGYQSTAVPIPNYTTTTTPTNINESTGTGTHSDGIFVPFTSSSNSSYIRLCQLPFVICRQSFSFMTVCFIQYRKQSLIALFLAITQQFCGQTNVISYAPSILARVSSSATTTIVESGSSNNINRLLEQQVVNVDEDSSFVDGWSTLSIGLVKFIVTVLVIWKIEHYGRRALLLCGMIIIAVGLLLLTIAFTDTSALMMSSNNYNASVSLIGVILVVTGYSMSFGPLSWLLTSELFPTEIRGRALGASTIVTYLCASVVTNTFLSAQTIFGSSAVFAFYMIITMFGLCFAFLAIPDTGGKNYDEITDSLDTMPWWINRRRETGSLWS